MHGTHYCSVCGLDSEKQLRTSHLPILQSRPNTLTLQSVWVCLHRRARWEASTMWPTMQSRKSSLFMNSWNGVLPKEHLETSSSGKNAFIRMGKRFCREVNTVHIIYWHVIFLLFLPLWNCFVKLIVKLLCSWLSIRPSYKSIFTLLKSSYFCDNKLKLSKTFRRYHLRYTLRYHFRIGYHLPQKAELQTVPH
jgi:hypothetical protein